MQRLRSFLTEQSDKLFSKEPTALEKEVASLIIELNDLWGPSGKLAQLKDKQAKIDAILSWWHRASRILNSASSIETIEPYAHLCRAISKHYVGITGFYASVHSTRRFGDNLHGMNDLHQMIYDSKLSVKKIHDRVTYLDILAQTKRSSPTHR